MSLDADAGDATRKEAGGQSRPQGSDGGAGKDSASPARTLDAGDGGNPRKPAVLYSARLDTDGAAPLAFAVDRTDGSSYMAVPIRNGIQIGDAGVPAGFLLVKIDPSGHVAWFKTWPTAGGLPSSLTVDGEGNVIIASSYTGSVDLGAGPVGDGPGDGPGLPEVVGIFVAKYTSAGKYVFGNTWRGADLAYAGSVVTTPDGRILFAGQFARGGIDFGDGQHVATAQVGFVVSLNGDGTFNWSRIGNGVNVVAVATDSANEAVVIGSVGGTADFGGPAKTAAGGGDFMVARFSPAGSQTEFSLFGSPTNSDQNPIAGVADTAGNVYLTGTLNTPTSFGGDVLPAGQAYIASLEPGGGHRYSFALKWDTSDWISDIAITSSGALFGTGAYSNTLVMDGLRIQAPISRAGMLFRVSPAGVVDWLHSYGGVGTTGGSANDSVMAVAATGTGDPVVAGVFEHSVDFGSGPLGAQLSVVVAELALSGK